MKTVIEMYHKAWPDDGAFIRASAQDLDHFAELVRADERDKWMERTAILIRGEREACAKVCDDLVCPPHITRDDASIWEVATLDCSEAIRARSNT